MGRESRETLLDGLQNQGDHDTVRIALLGLGPCRYEGVERFLALVQRHLAFPKVEVPAQIGQMATPQPHVALHAPRRLGCVQGKLKFGTRVHHRLYQGIYHEVNLASHGRIDVYYHVVRTGK